MHISATTSSRELVATPSAPAPTTGPREWGDIAAQPEKLPTQPVGTVVEADARPRAKPGFERFDFGGPNDGGRGASPYELASDAASRLRIAVGAEEARDPRLGPRPRRRGDGRRGRLLLPAEREACPPSTLLRLSRLPRREPKTFEGFDSDPGPGRGRAGQLPSLAATSTRTATSPVGPGGIGRRTSQGLRARVLHAGLRPTTSRRPSSGTGCRVVSRLPCSSAPQAGSGRSPRCIGRRVSVVAMPGGIGPRPHGGRGGGGARPGAAAGPIVYEEAHYLEALRGEALGGRRHTRGRAPTSKLLDALGAGTPNERRRRGEPSIGARDNLSALGAPRDGGRAARLRPDGGRRRGDFCSALEEMTRVEVAGARRDRPAAHTLLGFHVREGPRRLRLGLPAGRAEGARRGARHAQVHRARRERAARGQAGRRQRPTSPWPSASGRPRGARGEVHGLRQARRGPPGRPGARHPEEATPRITAHSKLLVIDELGYLASGEGRRRPALPADLDATSRGPPSSPPTSGSAAGEGVRRRHWRRAP